MLFHARGAAEAASLILSRQDPMQPCKVAAPKRLLTD